MSALVLFVDDDRNILDAVSRALRQEPYEIQKATSAEEALRMLSRIPADVVVTDEQMPGMSGTAFLSRVRELYPDTVRFMLTGKATIDLAINAINSGGITRFFLKPCESMELSVAIRQALEQRQLMLAARRLLEKTKQQGALLERLEKSHPNITHVDRDEDGAITIQDIAGDPESLIREICAHLEKGR
ncbi:MAG TPA: response regulator [Acidobacteriota bacterium]|nr:response regulator [Acidobacteriota bacterium]